MSSDVNTLTNWGTWSSRTIQNSSASLSKNSLQAGSKLGNLEKYVPVLRKLIRNDTHKRLRSKTLYRGISGMDKFHGKRFLNTKTGACFVTTQPLSFSTDKSVADYFSNQADMPVIIVIKTKAYLDFKSAVKEATKNRKYGLIGLFTGNYFRFKEKLAVSLSKEEEEAIVPPGAFIKRKTVKINDHTFELHFDFVPDSTYMKPFALHKPREFAKKISRRCKFDREFK